MTDRWNKFTLLIWKNWTLQKRHKLRTAIEILSPVIFVSLLVLVRSLVEPKFMAVKEYKEFSARTFIIDGKSILASNCTKLPKYKFSYSPLIQINGSDPIHDIIEGSLRYMFRTELKNSFRREVNLTNVVETIKVCYQNIQNIISNTDCIPSANMLDCLIDHMIEIKGYNNSNDMERQLIDPAQNDTSMCGIQFDDSLKDFFAGDGIWPNHTNLTLRFPAQLRNVMIMNPFFNWRTNFLYPVFQVPGPRTTMQKSPRFENYGGWPSYVHEGFMPVAHSIFHEITKLKTNETGPNLSIRRFPHPPYLKDDLIPVLQSFISLIIMLTFNYTCINTVKSIAVEKEKQLKEVMKIMGLSNWLHWTAWFVKSFVYLFFSTILIVLLLKVQWYQTDDGVSGYSVFTYTPWHLLLFFIVMYIITMIFFCFMISTFFSKANTAATMAGLLWFVSYFPYSFLSTDKILPLLSTRLLSCLSINTAMGFGFEIILMNEATSEGMQWNKLFTPLTVDDRFVMGHVLLMFVFDSFLYLMIALYVEQVFPGSYGVPQPWYFLITKDYWRSICKNIGDVEDVPTNYEASMNNMIEPDPKGLNVGINIVNLTKIYDKKMAVEKLNLKIFEDQITVLLGHNGAGKTTTMSMLTGMFPPTSGTAVVAGYDIRRDIEGVRDSLGLCPQHNVLFSDLTVAEHIYFYARLKGISGDALTIQVNKYVNLLGLDSKRDVVSSSLSGGMQRRLSVGTALCGGSRVVLLDEPSSGMDPSARRELWDLLHLEKKGRTMILTTHFMDEAEILGERVAILSGGKLRCVGSPFYLKKKFGIGYRLTVTRQPLSPSRSIALSAPITNLLTAYIPSVKLYTDIGSEISYILPEEKSLEFEPMLRDLEDKQEELNLSGFGITASTLEEVFMRVGADTLKYNDEDLVSNKSETNNLVIENDTSTLSNDVIKYEEFDLLINQWKAMFIKKFLVSLRSWVLHLLQLILPVFFLSMAIIISRMWSNPIELPARVLDLSETYRDSVTLMSTTQDVKYSNITQEYRKYFKDTHIHEMKLVDINSDNMTAYYLQQAAEDMPTMRVKNVAGVSFKSNKVTAWFSNFPYHDLPVSVMLAQNAILKSYSPESSFTLVNHPLPFTITSQFEMLMYGNGGAFQISFNIGLGMAFVSSFYLLFYIKENVSKSKLLQLASGVSPITMWSVAFIWDMLWFMIISIFVCITLIAFQQDGLSTASEIGRIFLVLMVFGWGMLPFQYIVSTRFTTPSTGFSRMCFFNFFTGLATFLIVEVMYAPGLDLENIADVLHRIFMIFPHYSLSGAVKNLNQASVTLQTCLKFCEIMMPNQYCTQKTVCDLKITSCCISDSPYFEWNKAGIGKHLFYMTLTGFILYMALIFKEYKIHNIIIKKQFDITPPPIDPLSEDDDVAAERARINNLLPEEYYKYNLLCNNMTKYYDKFLAVNQLSIGVKDSECFGLLGINGAGKTTTFKMLTGDLQISSGEAWVKGFSVNWQMDQVYQNIGYCPQFDALLDEMTGRETLQMYSLIRGIPKWRQECFIADISKKLGFTKHLDKKVGKYSGGNKRKLSTSIALLGEPQVVYLDEPTTGMDPAAKRLVWNAIAGCQCVILTSHSMEECEALCSKLAIMVNGQPKCLGSPQHLKNKFSQGYTLIIKLRRSIPVQNGIDATYPDILINPSNNTSERANDSGVNSNFDFSRLDDFLKSKFSDAKIIETYQGLITYHLPYAGVRWSAIFGVMEMAKEELNIEDYSIGQTSLEQIFLQFTKDQKATKDD